jgi:hypothetical protein
MYRLMTILFLENFRELMISGLKTGIQKLMKRTKRRRQQHVNQFLSIVKQCSDWIHAAISFLSGIPNVPKSIIRNLEELEKFT